MKKYIKRNVLNFYRIRIESCMSTVQLLRTVQKGKSNLEILTMPTYTPILTFYINTKDGSWENRQIRITDRSIKRFLLILKKVLEWFYDENKKDLFYFDQNNILTFNYTYKDLEEVYYDPFNQNTFLKLIPATVERNNKMFEGVNIYINQLETMIGITRIEIEDMLAILSGFSFQQESLILMTAFLIAKNEPNGIIDSGFYIQQEKMNQNLKAVPIQPQYSSRKNPFEI